MGKNLKKVIFSVLLLAAVIVVSPKDAKAAGNDLAGFCRYNAGNSSGKKRIFRIYKTGIQTYTSFHRKKI